MYVRLLFGQDAGKVRFVINHVARALLANGRAEMPDALPPAPLLLPPEPPAAPRFPFGLLAARSVTSAGKSTSKKFRKAR